MICILLLLCYYVGLEVGFAHGFLLCCNYRYSLKESRNKICQKDWFEEEDVSRL